MKLIITVALIMCMAAALPLYAQTPSCPEGRKPAGDIGIQAVRCSGPSASCAIWVKEQGKLRHSFAVEPVISALHADVQEQTPFHIGDAIVAIDGLLITTAQGGRELAQLPVGKAVTVTLRRSGSVQNVKVVARSGCGITKLRVTR